MDEFTQCFLGEKEPNQAFGKKLTAKNDAMMATLMGHVEVQQLSLVADRALQCL